MVLDNIIVLYRSKILRIDNVNYIVYIRGHHINEHVLGLFDIVNYIIGSKIKKYIMLYLFRTHVYIIYGYDQIIY